MISELVDFIRGFQVLTEDEVQLIVENTTVKSFKKGDLLLSEGQIASKCYLILKGCVREYYLVDGLEKSTAFYTEFDPVASFTSQAQQTPSKHFLVCAEDCVLTVGTQDLEREMCERIPRLEALIRQEVEKETGKAHDDLVNYITFSPEERYLNLMKERPDLLNRIPQHQIASYLGVTPESLSRIRKRMLLKA